GSQGFFQWEIDEHYQRLSSDPNSEFYGMSLGQYLEHISTKYESLAEQTLNRFASGEYSYGVCPCSWVNDNVPQRGQYRGQDANGNPIYEASYGYVEHATQYGAYFKVY